MMFRNAQTPVRSRVHDTAFIFVQAYSAISLARREVHRFWQWSADEFRDARLKNATRLVGASPFEEM